ncbi:hypothetical protein ACQFX9_20545 [Aliinostoc sp. HNIBRCY26]|uniref:hypothetical protein n=1 Tax=Aliinostoc sp. HNIBRCY26 TaxID=3418997 RepID=UPI003CFE3429
MGKLEGLGIGDWGLGTGDWGHFGKLSASLGTGDWGLEGRQGRVYFSITTQHRLNAALPLTALSTQHSALSTHQL